MAKYGQDDFDIEVDDSDGGSLTSMKAYVDTIDGMEVERILEQSDTFGDSWVEQLYTGIRRGNTFTIEGFYDDTASTGPDAVFNGTHVQTRSVRLTWGGTKTSSFEAWFQKYRRMAVRGRLTRYQVTIVPSGAVTEA